MLNERRKFALTLGVLAALLLVSEMPVTNGQGETVTAVELTPYEANPLLTAGESGAWNESGVGEPRVIFQDGLFHMFYLGQRGQPSIVGQSVGYATSEDGLYWTPFEANPVFVLDASISPWGIYSEITTFDGSTWVMFFTPFLRSVLSPASQILRATASDPTGPWTVDPDPVFERNSVKDWDYGDLTVESVLTIDNEHVLYYCTSPNGRGWFGRATSPDMVTWTKYDELATTQALLAASDPVFQKGKNGSWDDYFLCCPTVYRGEFGWEMFYAGDDLTTRNPASTGFATSEDGLTWTRFGDIPVLRVPDTQIYVSSVVVVDGTYDLYYTFWDSSDMAQIGLATGTVTWE